MSNQRRFLAQLLSIDAWHEPFRYDGATSSVHVELSFQNGRMGGDDPTFPFTFNIALKRALLTVSLEAPLQLDRNTVARNIPANQAELTRIVAARSEAKSSTEFAGRITPTSLSAMITGSHKSDSSRSKEDNLKFVQDVPRIIAIPRPAGAQEYSWELIPGHDEILDGQPWDPTKEPRFSVKSLDKKSAIDPSVKIIVTCKLEDISIECLELKDVSIKAMLKEAAFNKVNMAAAIHHLKITLRDMYLEVGEFGDKFSSMQIADIISAES